MYLFNRTLYLRYIIKLCHHKLLYIILITDHITGMAVLIMQVVHWKCVVPVACVKTGKGM